MVTADWNDAPHLDSAAKAELLLSIPEYERDARARGIPFLGSGRIYPFPWEDVSVDDFPIPPHWPQGYGLDVGWNATAATWGAYNPDTDTRYMWSEHKDGQASPILHAASIKARGTWIPGDIDPSANGERNLDDGRQLTEIYRKEIYGDKDSLMLQLADNTVQAGIYAVLTLLQTGRLKFFKSLTELRHEFLLYHRDKGKVVKRHDHLMDAMRYAIKRMHDRWIVKPATAGTGNAWVGMGATVSNEGWMGR
jgi:hypothetical protein